MKQQFSIRVSSADRKTLEIAARMTGRSVGEYIREMSVTCAIQQVILRGGRSRLPAEHQKLLSRQEEQVLVGDVSGADNQRRFVG